MASFNLADILTQAGEMQSIIRGDIKKTELTQEQSQALREEQVNAADSMIKLSVDQARMEGEQKLQMEKRKAATASAFGTDILDPTNRLAYLASEQAAAIDESIYQSKRAASLKETAFFDSPLAYMMARPFAARNDELAVSASTRANVIDKAIDDLNSQTQSTVQTQAAIQEAWNTDQQANKLEQVAVTAAQAVRQLKINQNTAYITDLGVLRGMGAEDIKNSTSAYTLKRQAEQFNAQMEEHKANRELRAQLAADRLKATKDAKEGLSQAMDAYNLAADKYGKRKITDLTQFTTMYSEKSPMRDIIGQMVNEGMSMGIDPSDPQTQFARSFVAATPGESTMQLRAVGGKLPDSAQRVTALLAETQSAVQQKLAKESGGKKITGDQMVAGINYALAGSVTTDEKGNKTTTKGVVQQMLQNFEADPSDRVKNIYRAPDVGTIASATPNLVKEKWWQTIVMPASLADGRGERSAISADNMMKQAALSIKKGDVTVEEAAAGLKTYYAAAIRTNQVNEQYSRVGLPIPTNYPTVISGGMDAWTGKGTGVLVDMLDEAKIKHRLALSTMRIPGLLR